MSEFLTVVILTKNVYNTTAKHEPLKKLNSINVACHIVPVDLKAIIPLRKKHINNTDSGLASAEISTDFGREEVQKISEPIDF